MLCALCGTPRAKGTKRWGCGEPAWGYKHPQNPEFMACGAGGGSANLGTA